MRAVFDGQDYRIFLDRENGELSALRQRRLDAPLMLDGDTSGKIAHLELGENHGPDGIELTYFPQEAESWMDIMVVEVKINETVYGRIKERGWFGTRYNGSDKIEILDGIQ